MKLPSALKSASPPVTDGAPTAADGRSSRWEKHRAERRRQLIKTARRAVDALGPSASMEDIAAAADTSKSVYYRYFGDKTGLQRAMAEVVIGQMQQKVLDAAKAAATPREGLHSMVLAYLQMAQTSPNVYAFVTRVGIAESAAADDGAQDTLAHFLAAITEMVSQPMRSYLLSPDRPAGPDDAAPEYWPAAAIGMVRAVGERWLCAPDGPDKPTEEQMARQITGWLFDGISRYEDLVPAAPLPPATRRPAKDTP
ncbi:TetR/AcrR family transcriptional regulator [Arthrobacter agilis]|jgi:AcrR family transcriptional regulator|uniref:TetR/AcrR family transcriptional regulator n=1 Tax=Arthrobacter agilis TaxID=37921 RepID=UPI00277F822C|nr:TetR/AcrR family transcriptional regulator [Arthrobacter agilis]MDQ0734647.1 AcrR family transcriptional regulator [Arthrobacter agilis]